MESILPSLSCVMTFRIWSAASRKATSKDPRGGGRPCGEDPPPMPPLSLPWPGEHYWPPCYGGCASSPTPLHPEVSGIHSISSFYLLPPCLPGRLTNPQSPSFCLLTISLMEALLCIICVYLVKGKGKDKDQIPHQGYLGAA